MHTQQKTITPRLVIQMTLFLLVIPLLPLLLSQRWGWWEAWVYAGVYILGFVISRALAGRRHPDLLAERARFTEHEDAKPWDRWLAPLVGLGGGLIPLVAGLDARFGSPPAFSLPVRLGALAVILIGHALGSYALVENRFFSGMVRIQTERGHRVVSTGPYRWMRHPGYAGALLTYLATPIFLETLWAYVPVALLTTALVVRTHLEDKALREELPGYAEYARRVRARLLPRVW
jgi:protein-S-isoprenylcysteine O-methyltransferase Ste14